MNTKVFVRVLTTILLVTCHPVQAQQTGKVPRIGYLAPGSGAALRGEAFRQGLRELGYFDGKNIIIEYRFAEGKMDRLPDLAAELVSLNVDVIVVSNSATARAAKKATSTIPIVMINAGNIFADGLVASLAQPGGNVTGLANLATDLGVKRLELIKESFPRVTRIAVLPSPSGIATERRELKEIQGAAPSLKVQLHIMSVRVADDFEKAFDAATKAHAGALLVTAEPTALLSANRKQIVGLAAKKRFPAIYPSSQYVNAGGLMSYSANELENARRAAVYVDKILKGTRPADLPVEQPMKFEFVINLNAAKQIGVTVPPNVLVRADRVIR